MNTLCVNKIQLEMQTNLRDVFDHADHSVGYTKVDAHCDELATGASQTMVDVPCSNLSKT